MQQNHHVVFKQAPDSSPVVIEKDVNLVEPELPLFICDNTDALLDPIDQMTYALNEVQVRYGGIVILKGAP